MSVVEEFADLLTQTCTVEPKATVDLYGKRSYGPAVTYPCRIEYKRRKISAYDGRDVTSDGKVIILQNPAIGPEDRLTINGTVVTLLSVEVFTDERGPHHLDLHFGSGS